jgi:uncharacterized protein (TIGR00730 family)
MSNASPDSRTLHVCVFCGSTRNVPAEHLRLARDFGERLARRGHVLVYGAGATGLMGELAEGALAAGGHIIGIAPADLFQEQRHPGIAKTILTADMAERKTNLLGLSDAVVALPGGVGTLDEWFEALTLRSIGKFTGPVALLDPFGFYAPLLDWLARLRGEGYIRPGVLETVVVESDPDRLLDRLKDPRHA